jgi:aminoglycoside phosphotransferase (APT) family kinase protein
MQSLPTFLQYLRVNTAPTSGQDVPEPIGLGEPGCGYPYRWSIYRWLEGDALSSVQMPISEQERLAKTLAKFLIALQRIDATAGLPPGPHNFYRGGSLLVYDNETREA